jgi:TorA maturation chaperone TorD
VAIDSYHNDLAKTYKLLASVFMETPNSELLQQVSEELEIQINDRFIDIVEDYNRLFYDTEDPLLPYESLYNYNAEEGPSLWNSTTQEVSDFYEACGLVLGSSVNVPYDHIGLEFLFVSYLIENEMIDELMDFFELHIMKWVPEYCEKLEQKAQTEFLRTIARITKEVVLSDYEELSYG